MPFVGDDVQRGARQPRLEVPAPGWGGHGVGVAVVKRDRHIDPPQVKTPVTVQREVLRSGRIDALPVALSHVLDDESGDLRAGCEQPRLGR